MIRAKISGVLRHLGASFLEEMLDPKRKRMIFLASLADILNINKNPLDETLHKLNDVFNLAMRQEALAPAAKFGKVIWQNKTPVEIFGEDFEAPTLDSGRIKQMAHQALKTIPCVFHYDKDEVIEKDLCELLAHRGVVFGF